MINTLTSIVNVCVIVRTLTVPYCANESRKGLVLSLFTTRRIMLIDFILPGYRKILFNKLICERSEEN